MALYGSDKVIISMKEFINKQNSQALNEVALAMRKYLYGIKTNLKDDNFRIEF